MQRATVLMLFFSLLPTLATAQQAEKKFQIGMRSTMILGHMPLSDIDPTFDDLSASGGIGKGAHHSGVFFLYTVRPYLRVGFETLVGNASEKEETTMDFQAAGAVLDLTYGNKLFVAGGIHAGPMIVDAMHRTGSASENKVQDGRFYKSAGLFFAPYVGVGTRIRSYEARVFVKSVNVAPVESSDPIDAFNASYGGVSVGFNF